MRRFLSENVSRRRLIAVLLSLSFIVGTVAVTIVQAETSKKSATIQIYPTEPGQPTELKVSLTIHHYTGGPNFAFVYYFLRIQNDYASPITVLSIYIKSMSDPEGASGAFVYGEETAINVYVPGGETVTMKFKQRVERLPDLIVDTSVYSYYSISWTHGEDSYFEVGRYDTNAAGWWSQLYP